MQIARAPLPAIGDRQKIQKYGAGRFSVSGQSFVGGVLVLPHQTLSWPATDVTALSEQAVEQLVAHAGSIDVCLMGCGPKTLLLPAALRARFKAANLRVDAMDTGSACRTFNVLVSEGRAVAAALIPLGT